MIIPITEKMKAYANHYEKEVLKNLKNKPNYTELEVERRYYIGYLGEFAFLKYCGLSGLKCFYNVTTNGQNQRADFILTKKYQPQGQNNISVDIKTTTNGHYQFFTVLESQFELYKYGYYVSIYIDGINATQANIRGYSERINFKYRSATEKERFNNYAVPIVSLVDIDILAGLCEHGGQKNNLIKLPDPKILTNLNG